MREETTRRLRQEMILVQQSKLAAIGEMLGAIAHQWRQPLNVLALVVQNLKDAHAHDQLDQHSIETTVDKAMLQIRHMSRTIEDFRRFFQPDKAVTDFDAMEAVGTVLTLVSAQLASNDIQFRLHCLTHGRTAGRIEEIVSCREKTVRGFRNEFEHVVLNLVENAREAILERRKRERAGAGTGLLEFLFRTEGGRAMVTLRDNGGGVDEHLLERIFEPFVTTKAATDCSGLGLYLARVIVEEHLHGELRAANEADGAAFTMVLPLAAEASSRG